ncbi:MAG TPA: hypothetical protein VJP79_09875, partial [Nitrososphaera sp.]|nr:hypothetical protein [Nitrososphaera sp.]
QGKQGDSLFFEPILTESMIAGWNARIPEISRKMYGASDDRSLAVVCALAVEAQMAQLLKLFLLGYDKSEPCTFEAKLNLLKIMNLIPKNLIDCADAIRKVRNAFGHDFEVESLDKLPTKAKSALESSYNTIPDREKSADPKEMLINLATILVHGLQDYEPVVRAYGNFIKSEEFREILKKTK